MQIESGTTAWWRNRHLMFLALFLGCGAWFAKDGYLTYPAENRKWAAQAMQVDPGSFTPNPKVTREAIAQLEQDGAHGLPLSEISKRFGDPTLVRESEAWFVGPDAYIKLLAAADGPKLDRQFAGRKTADMVMQKICALGLLVLALIVAAKLIRVQTTRVVLDENGLRYNGKRIPWEQMTGLRGQDYARKGWADLEYAVNGGQKTFRLDSYHIAKFEEIVSAICERKGFPSPLAVTTDEAGEAESENADLRRSRVSCPKCHQENPGGASYCANCGHVFKP